MTNARSVSDRLAELLRREHHALADFLVALADFDRRRLWEELGNANLFAFLHRELGLSRGSAFYRKVAAELVQRHPEVIEPLRDGRLCLTSVVELAKVLTAENRDEVLPRFFHRSKQEAKAISAELGPQEVPPRRDVVTSLWSGVARVEPAGTRAVPAVLASTGSDRTTDASRGVQPDELVHATRSTPLGPSRRARLRATSPSRSRATCAACMSRSRAASSTSWTPRATRSRTPGPAPRPRRCWRPRSTSCSRSARSGRPRP